MLGIILKILCILGWIVLFLLGLLILIVCLVLFFPVSYRIGWQKDTESMTADVRLKWLFGIVAGSFAFPEPGTLIIRLFGLRVFDSGKADTDSSPEGGAETAKKGSSPEGGRDNAADADTKSSRNAASDADSAGDKCNVAADADSGNKCETAADAEDSGNKYKAAADADSGNKCKAASDADSGTNGSGTANEEHGRHNHTDKQDTEGETASENEAASEKASGPLQTFGRLSARLKRLRELAASLLAILKEEDTGLLFSHVMLRTGRILKSIRPRKIEGRLTFGTGSPDTTGYGMALYGMLSPFLGQNLSVTPDFEEAVLEGQLSAKGRIFIITLLYNGLRILLDRRLRQFIRKIKREVK